MIPAVEERCAVLEALEYFRDFAQKEMCGRCLPCMLGTDRIIWILDKITRGEGISQDMEFLRLISSRVNETARCKKGREAAQLLSDSLSSREREYWEHIEEKHCPKKSCKDLISYRVVAERCTRCGSCKSICPEEAILGDEYIPYLADNRPYIIMEKKCTKCGLCLSTCEADAIILV